MDGLFLFKILVIVIQLFHYLLVPPPEGACGQREVEGINIQFHSAIPHYDLFLLDSWNGL